MSLSGFFLHASDFVLVFAELIDIKLLVIVCLKYFFRGKSFLSNGSVSIYISPLNTCTLTQKISPRSCLLEGLR